MIHSERTCDDDDDVGQSEKEEKKTKYGDYFVDSKNIQAISNPPQHIVHRFVRHGENTSEQRVDGHGRQRRTLDTFLESQSLVFVRHS